MKAKDIRQLFLEPELKKHTLGETMTADVAQSLLLAEIAAQLAEITAVLKEIKDRK